MAESKEDKIKKLRLDIDQVTRTPSVLNMNAVQKIFNSTPTKWQYKRPARGGGEWTYVKASYVRKVLDSVFGFNWSFDIETSLSEAFEIAAHTGYCVVKGTLTGRVYRDKEWVAISKTQFGRAQVKFEMVGTGSDRRKKIDPISKLPITLDFGNDMKAATSDCLKKCASMFGIAADIYEADEFIEYTITGTEGNTEKDKATKRQIEAAKKAISAGSEKVGEQNEGAK